MNPAPFIPPPMAGFKKSPPHEGQSSGSDSKRPETAGAKRRASRAGTRSVSSLSAAQLERKRQNDREAQRAIRQRTKDHIANLERQIQELTAERDSNSSTKWLELMRRNEELEQENAVLRARLSQAVTALGVPEQGPATVLPGSEGNTLMSATGTAPSPSDRVQILSQPRPSAETPRSIHSVPEIPTPVSQSGHWQAQQAYSSTIASPHGQGSPHLGHVPPAAESVRWSHHPHPHPPQQISMPVHDPTHTGLEAGSMSYPSPYAMDSHSRALSYPLETAQLVTAQPMHMGGYSTPTSARSPHPSDYPRHSLAINTHTSAPHPTAQHPHSQQHTPQTPYSSFSPQGHPGFVPQGSHPGDVQPMMAPQPPQHAIGEAGHMVYQSYPPNMKGDQH
ncbi:hypothetical protein M011DRAFT_473674 [Sporormia fimetaria CBS 119925]|uniref:BZIP domain-containing protein n=1 Tax=Sporormia fimetaria CBS 119925 TaxID=1340428 RepID=A0A6A6VLY1_9PLEO|nr:hypothetical protein M011DRAFT_473674 [Sporormia fimetaria CBS 119925]